MYERKKLLIETKNTTCDVTHERCADAAAHFAQVSESRGDIVADDLLMKNT